MSRFTRQERRARRAAFDEAAALGEDWLRVRDRRTFEDFGFSTFEDYLRFRAPRMLPAVWGLTAEQASEFVREAVALASSRRLGVASRGPRPGRIPLSREGVERES